MHRSKSFSLDEDDIEPKKSLQQKEVISTQMIGVIQSRLDSLRIVGNITIIGFRIDKN